MQRKKTRSITLKEAKLKAASFCAYQERTQDEVRQRMLDWGLRYDEADELIAFLISENFINEERFAKSYAGGKFRLKKWGRIKIQYGLKQKGLSDYCIRSAMREIDEDDYLATLFDLAQKKWDGLVENDPFIRKKKCFKYLQGKGFEIDLIKNILTEINP